MIAIYSLWNMHDEAHSAGFNSIDDLMGMMKLSMLQSKKFFDRIVLVTDSIGATRAVRYELPCDEVKVAFDHLSYDRCLWAMPKLLALGSVYEAGMMHIDNDFIWWSDPAVFWGDADMLFQNKEAYTDYPYYGASIIWLAERYPDLYAYINQSDYAYNCGVIGIKDTAIVDEWMARAMALIHTPDILSMVPQHDRAIVNLIYEQGFIASLSVEYNLHIHTILDSAGQPTRDITHLLSGSKRNQKYMAAVRMKLTSLMSMAGSI
jgi:hypothetical protein